MSTVTCCDECGVEAAEDDLYLCALSVPWAERHECADCCGECGPCRDEQRQQWNDEHGITNMRRH